MALPKVCGIETEYGIVVRGGENNPVSASSLLINAYVSATSRRVGWDFDDEHPANDARGFSLDDVLAPEVETTLVNAVLTNGARYYVDHAHPEISTPEVSNAREAVVWDRAAEEIVRASMEYARPLLAPGGELVVYKNNSDGKGNSYGCHENYLVDRDVDFYYLAEQLIPFLVTRQIYSGAGKVFQTQDGVHYCVSQRAQHIYQKISGTTTNDRSIINTRDEPHADREKYRRLHVIVGDANMSEISTYLKCGALALVLGLIEDDVIDKDFSLENPVLSYRKVSRDLSCRETVKLKDGRELTPVEIQWEFLGQARRHYDRKAAEPWAADILTRWESMLTRLGRDPLSCDREIDWVIKYHLIEAYRKRHDLPLTHPRVALLDLSYHDVTRSRSLYYLLERRGRVARTVSDADIETAVTTPPQTTRARLRGAFIKRAKERKRDYTVDWVHLKLNDQAQRTVLCKDPFKSRDDRVERLISSL